MQLWTIYGPLGTRFTLFFEKPAAAVPTPGTIWTSKLKRKHWGRRGDLFLCLLLNNYDRAALPAEHMLGADHPKTFRINGQKGNRSPQPWPIRHIPTSLVPLPGGQNITCHVHPRQFGCGLGSPLLPTHFLGAAHFEVNLICIKHDADAVEVYQSLCPTCTSLHVESAVDSKLWATCCLPAAAAVVRPNSSENQ